MQKLRQAYCILGDEFAMAALLHLAETIDVDVALIDAEYQLVEVLDGSARVASILRRAAAIAAAAAAVFLVGAFPGGVPGFVAFKAEALCHG